MKINKDYKRLLKIVNILLPVLNNNDEEGFYLEDQILETIIYNSIYSNNIENYIMARAKNHDLTQAQE